MCGAEGSDRGHYSADYTSEADLLSSWAGTAWTYEIPGITSRTFSNAASLGGVLYLFGGRLHTNGFPATAETWAYDGSRWVKMATGGPPASWGGAMVTLRDKMVMFGGKTATAYFGETWVWDSRWTRAATTALGPGERAFAGFVAPPTADNQRVARSGTTRATFAGATDMIVRAGGLRVGDPATKLYVASAGGGSVSILPSTGAGSTVATGGSPAIVRGGYNPTIAGGPDVIGWLDSSTNTIRSADPATLTPSEALTTPSAPIVDFAFRTRASRNDRAVYAWSTASSVNLSVGNGLGGFSTYSVAGENGPSSLQFENSIESSLAYQVLYWTSYGDGTVRRKNLDAPGSPSTLASGGAYALANDSEYVYFTAVTPASRSSSTSSVKAIRKADGTILSVIAGGLKFPSSIAVDDGVVYVADRDTGTIASASSSGATYVARTLATGESMPSSIGFDATNIYWLDSRGNVRMRQK